MCTKATHSYLADSIWRGWNFLFGTCIRCWLYVSLLSTLTGSSFLFFLSVFCSSSLWLVVWMSMNAARCLIWLKLYNTFFLHRSSRKVLLFLLFFCCYLIDTSFWHCSLAKSCLNSWCAPCRPTMLFPITWFLSVDQTCRAAIWLDDWLSGNSGLSAPEERRMSGQPLVVLWPRSRSCELQTQSFISFGSVNYIILDWN